MGNSKTQKRVIGSIWLWSGGFFLFIVMILLIKSKTPLGIDLSDDTIRIAQTVNVQPVRYQPSYISKREFIGQIEARQTSQLGFEFSGQIATIGVDEGDYVQKGTRLASLDVERLHTASEEAKAALQRAETDLKLAAKTYQRILRAWKLDAVSIQDKDEAAQTKDSASASVAAAKARLNTIQVNIKKSVIYAPFSGVVLKRTADQGAVIKAGEAFITLQQQNGLEARFGLSANMLEKIKTGQKISAYKGDKAVALTVKSIVPAINSVRSFDVITAIETDEATLRSGTLLRLPLGDSIKARGFWVPNNALREGRRGLWSVFVAEKTEDQNDVNATHKAVRRNIEIIDAQSGQSYVSGSVDDGEPLIIKGAHKLVPGQLIRLTGHSEEANL